MPHENIVNNMIHVETFEMKEALHNSEANRIIMSKFQSGGRKQGCGYI